MKCANGADGISDIEGKVARVATSKLGNERVSISRRHWQARWTGQPARADALARKTDGRNPRGQTRSDQSGQGMASSRPQTVKAQVADCDPIVSGLRSMSETCCSVVAAVSAAKQEIRPPGIR